MFGYIVRRTLATVPVLSVVALFVFSLLYISPGDPAVIIAGEFALAEDIERIRRDLGLDMPFLERFGVWVFSVLRGDFGVSIFSGLPVTQLIAQRVEPTLALTVSTLLLSVPVAIPLGAIAAAKAGSWIDRAIMVGCVIGFSVPVFVIAYLLVLGFSVELNWLPVQGYVPLSQGLGRFLPNLVLPSLALSLVYMALIARITRSTILDVLAQDYVRTAKAKGLDGSQVLIRHALKNAAIPIVTVIGMGVAGLIGGVVVTETVFSIPGLGRLTVDAIMRRDYPVIQGLLLMFSAAYVLINLLVDLTYPLFDPKIRY